MVQLTLLTPFIREQFLVFQLIEFHLFYFFSNDLKFKCFQIRLKIYNNFFSAVASACSYLRVQQLSAVICLLFLLIYLSLQPLDFHCRIIFYKPPEAADNLDPKTDQFNAATPKIFQP